MTRLARLLERHGGTTLRARQMSLWEYQVLAALRRDGPPYELNPSQRREPLMISSGAMTNRIDQLERAGLV